MKWPEIVVRDIARRRAVLFLGAGVSANSVGADGKRPPTWIQFLEDGYRKCPNPKKHIKTLIRDKDLLTACEIIKSKFDEDWPTFLRESFVDPAYATAKIHEYIYLLDSSLVFTPNFDKIFETYAQNQSSGTIQLKNYTDVDLPDIVRGNIPAILKFHGTIDHPQQMIFTKNEYTEARQKHPSFYALVDALAVSHTFIFVGCGLSDPDFQLFLQKSVQTYPGAAPHYILLPKPIHSDIQESIRRNLNLKVLPYSKENNHEELTRSLGDLVKLVENKREELSDTQQW